MRSQIEDGFVPGTDILNGEKSVRMELRRNIYIPSKICLGGAEISVWYPGQKKTCQSCHYFSSLCRAGGNARKCKLSGGGRKLEVAMVDYYNLIGFVYERQLVENEVPPDFEVEQLVILLRNRQARTLELEAIKN